MGTTKRLTLLLALASLLALPLAAAQESSGEEQQMPDEIDVNVEDNRDQTPQESVGADDGDGDGLGATTMVILVVLGIVVIGLIVALAARRP